MALKKVTLSWQSLPDFRIKIFIIEVENSFWNSKAKVWLPGRLQRASGSMENMERLDENKDLCLWDKLKKGLENLLKKIVLIIVSIGLLTSCVDMSKKVEEKIDELTKKTEKLDSLVNKEFDKVIALDSLVNMEGGKVKKLDSLIKKSSSKLDSFANQKINMLRKISN